MARIRGGSKSRLSRGAAKAVVRALLVGYGLGVHLVQGLTGDGVELHK